MADNKHVNKFRQVHPSLQHKPSMLHGNTVKPVLLLIDQLGIPLFKPRDLSAYLKSLFLLLGTCHEQTSHGNNNIILYTHNSI